MLLQAYDIIDVRPVGTFSPKGLGEMLKGMGTGTLGSLPMRMLILGLAEYSDVIERLVKPAFLLWDMSQRYKRRKLERGVGLPTFGLSAILVVVSLLIYFERTALLYVLATLGVTALLLVVAFADLGGDERSPIRQAISPARTLPTSRTSNCLDALSLWRDVAASRLNYELAFCLRRRADVNLQLPRGPIPILVCRSKRQVISSSQVAD